MYSPTVSAPKAATNLPQAVPPPGIQALGPQPRQKINPFFMKPLQPHEYTESVANGSRAWTIVVGGGLSVTISEPELRQFIRDELASPWCYASPKDAILAQHLTAWASFVRNPGPQAAPIVASTDTLPPPAPLATALPVPRPIVRTSTPPPAAGLSVLDAKIVIPKIAPAALETL